jgi:hypothetical protein
MRIGVSHRRNAIIGGYVPERPKENYRKRKRNEFCHLKRNIQEPEPDYATSIGIVKIVKR